jgi:hypothetical protein
MSFSATSALWLLVEKAQEVFQIILHLICEKIQKFLLTGRSARIHAGLSVFDDFRKSFNPANFFAKHRFDDIEKAVTEAGVRRKKNGSARDSF